MIRVLLLDDHPVLRQGVRSVLETQLDIEVVAEASSAAEAAHAAADSNTAIDVALVDLDLGDGEPDGIAAIKSIKQGNPAIQALVFSAYDSDADIVRAMEVGAAGYLVKDSRPAELFRSIRAAAAGDSLLEGAIGARLLDRIEQPGAVLTPRELEVLTLAASGLSNRDLARELHLSEATVKTHLHHVSTKLGTDSRQAAIATAAKLGIIRR